MTTSPPLLIPFETLLQNDTGTQLRVTAVSEPGLPGATVSMTANGVLYAPPLLPTLDRVGDQFSYEITDNLGQTSIANVNVTLTSVVIATDDALGEYGCGLPHTIRAEDLLENDRGVELTVSSVGDAVSGKVQLSGNVVTYTAPSCKPALREKTLVARQRYAIGNATSARSLLADTANVNTLEPGDLIVLSGIGMGTSEIESGWTLFGDSAQSKLYYRWADAAYIAQHDQKKTDPSYPYYKVGTTGSAVAGAATVRAMSYKPLKGVKQSDFILDYSVTTTTGKFRFDRGVQSFDYYRNNYIKAYGPGGEQDTNGTPPTFIASSIFDYDSWPLGRMGNMFWMDAEGDADASIGAEGPRGYSEVASLSNASNIYIASFTLREIPAADAPIAEDSFPYTARDKYGVTDTGRVTLKVRSPILTPIERFRAVGVLENEDGFAAVQPSVDPPSFAFGLFTKSIENTTGPGNPPNPEFPARLDNPSDPQPNWNILGKSQPDTRIATTVVYRPVDASYYEDQAPGGRFGIEAFEGHRDLAGRCVFLGFSFLCNEGDRFGDFFVRSDTRIYLPSSGNFTVPTILMSDDCSYYTFNVVRPYTATVVVSGGSSQIIFQSRSSRINTYTFITKGINTTTNLNVSMDGYVAGGDSFKISTTHMVLKNFYKYT